MKKISIDELINMVDSNYSLVTIVSRRARQIIDGSQVLIDTDTTKPVAIAIEEFYEGAYQPIYDYDLYMKELEEAEDTEDTEERASEGSEDPAEEEHDNDGKSEVKEEPEEPEEPEETAVEPEEE